MVYLPDLGCAAKFCVGKVTPRLYPGLMLGLTQDLGDGLCCGTKCNPGFVDSTRISVSCAQYYVHRACRMIPRLQARRADGFGPGYCAFRCLPLRKQTPWRNPAEVFITKHGRKVRSVRVPSRSSCPGRGWIGSRLPPRTDDAHLGVF